MRKTAEFCLKGSSVVNLSRHALMRARVAEFSDRKGKVVLSSIYSQAKGIPAIKALLSIQ